MRRPAIFLGAIFALFLEGDGAAALDRLVAPAVDAVPGIPVDLPIEASNDLEIHGFSIAISWDGAPADLESLGIEGTEVASLAPDFVEPITDPEQCAAVLAVIVELSPPFDPRGLAPAETLRPIAKARFALHPRPAPGRHPIRFVEGIQIGGAGVPVRNVFSHAGQSIAPSLEDGALIVENPNRLRIGEAEIRAGGRGDIIARATHPEPLEGYEIAVIFPSGPLVLESIGVEALDVVRLVGPRGQDGGIEFVHPRIVDPLLPGVAWGGIGVQFDTLEPFAGQTLPAGEDQSVARFRFRVADGAEPGVRHDIELRDGYGTPPLENAFLIGGRSQLPDLAAGAITVLEPGRFVRGDGNGDGEINIGDPIHGLSYIFASGPGDCRDAIDANDDGAIDIADPIMLLGYIFSSEAEPPLPFPEPGVDPTPDELDCDR
ncbi:MAG: hypothetical protein JXP34_00245 [Planctomycetes bacterium]|nr:hypothetical protein [Planctomycetota bacterium]